MQLDFQTSKQAFVSLAPLKNQPAPLQQTPKDLDVLPYRGFCGPSHSWGPSSSLCSSATDTAKSLQSYLTLCDPTDDSPPGSPIPGVLQVRVLEWGAIAFSNA